MPLRWWGHQLADSTPAAQRAGFGWQDLAAAAVALALFCLPLAFSLVRDVTVRPALHRRRMRRLIGGDTPAAWRRVRALWADAAAVHDTRWGWRPPAEPRPIEYEAALAFIRHHPDAGRVLREALNDPPPFVVAYAIQALFALNGQRDLPAAAFPPGLFRRAEPVGHRQNLGNYARWYAEKTPAEWYRLEAYDA